jgi:hypothetical protein
VNQGGTLISDYPIQRSIAASNNWTTFPDGTSTVTSSTVTGLNENTSYDFRVAAVNSNGLSPYSAIYTVSTSGLVVSNNLLFYYDFENNYDDSTGNNPTLSTIVGTPAFANIATLGNVLDVRNGTRGVTGLNITSSYSKCAWFYTLNGTQNFQNIMSDISSGQAHIFGLYSDFQGPPGTASGVTLKASHRSDYIADVGHTANFTNNTAYHGTVTYDAATTTMRLYVNGIESSVNTSVAAPTASLTTFSFSGFSSSFDFRINGYIDKLRLYNRAITAAEVLQIYNNEQP